MSASQASKCQLTSKLFRSLRRSTKSPSSYRWNTLKNKQFQVRSRISFLTNMSYRINENSQTDEDVELISVSSPKRNKADLVTVRLLFCCCNRSKTEIREAWFNASCMLCCHDRSKQKQVRLKLLQGYCPVATTAPNRHKADLAYCIVTRETGLTASLLRRLGLLHRY